MPSLTVHQTSETAASVEDYLEELQGLDTDSARSRYFRSHPALVCRHTVDALASRATSLLRVDPREAQNLIGTALWIAEELDDDFARGKANRAAANLAHVRGDQSQALLRYQLAKDFFTRTGADLEAAITASSSLQALAFQGKHDHALRETEFARDVFEHHGDRLRLARLNANYANLLYHRDRWAEAAHHYEAAYRDFLEIGEKQDVAVCLGNMAVCHLKRHDFPQALAFYRRTRGYCEQNGLTALTADLDYNIAYLHYLRGQYTTALELYRETRARHSELGNKHVVDLCALNEAEIYLELNLTGECADLAKTAYSGFRDRGHNLESAKALTILAIADSRDGKIFLALELFARAQEIFQQEKNDISVALIDLYRATVYSRAGRSVEGRRLSETAAAAFQRFAVPTKAAACQVLLARLNMEQRSWGAAEASCLAALHLLIHVDAPALSFQAYYLLAEVQRSMARDDEAHQSYVRAHEQLERITGALQTEEQRILAFDDRLVLYESFIEFLIERAVNENDRMQAFEVVEKAKSRSLTDLLAFRAYALPATQPGRSKLADQVRQLREELNWYYRQIDLQEMRAEDRSVDDVEALRRYSRQQESRLIRTLSLLQQTDQEFSSVQDAFSVDVEALRSSLPEDTTLIEYYVAKGTVLAFVVDKERTEVVPTTLASTVEELRRSLAAELSRTPADSFMVRDDRRKASLQHLGALYEELVEPIETLIGGDRILVVPHGSLFYLPFHGFQVRGTSLSDIYPVSYAPSATAYHLARRKTRTTGMATEAAILLSASAQDDPSLVELARRISTVLPHATIIEGGESIEERLGSRKARARVIHLVTRGQLRDDNPMFSTVHLGSGPVHFFDLFQLRMDADLVAISGCSPGLEAGARGNEIVGLVRGLLYAGARSVLTTLWQVDDRTWSEFSEAFYPMLATGHSAENALQTAMSALREVNPNPAHWAPFVLFGDAR